MTSEMLSAGLQVVRDYMGIALEYVILLLELVGVVVIVISAAKATVGYFTRQRRCSVRLRLAEGLSLALEFKLGSEILRTVLAREWQEILICGAIILLRGVLNFLIHQEIKNEEARIGGRHEDA